MENLQQECKNWLPAAIPTDSTGGRKLCYNSLFIKEELPPDGKMHK